MKRKLIENQQFFTIFISFQKLDVGVQGKHESFEHRHDITAIDAIGNAGQYFRWYHTFLRRI